MPRPDRNAPISLPPNTSFRMVALYRVTLPLLVALRDVARPQALRRGASPVPPDVLDEARPILADARRVLFREDGVAGLLHLRPQLDWAGLLTRLELALAAFASFKANYCYVTRLEGEVWRDEEWVSFHLARARSASAGNHLHES